MTVALIKKDKAEQQAADPLRAALAAAIEAEAEARSTVDTAEENLKRGHAFVATAQSELDRAKALVEKAKERDSRANAAAVRNRAGASPDASSTRSARAAVQGREDDLEVAQGAIARLEQDVAESETALQWAIVERMAAANAALAPVAQTLVDRLRDVRLETARTKALLLELLNDLGRGIPGFSDALSGMKARDLVTKELSALRSDAERLFISGTNDEERAAVAVAVAGMRAFVDRLAGDATAEPPTP